MGRHATPSPHFLHLSLKDKQWWWKNAKNPISSHCLVCPFGATVEIWQPNMMDTYVEENQRCLYIEGLGKA